MKASRLLTLFPVAAAMMLVACNGGGSSTDSSNTNTGTDSTGTGTTGPIIKEKTEIYFWNTFSYETQITNIINKFKEIEPNVTVTNVKQNGDYNDLKDMVVQGFAGDNYPDIAVAYPDHVAEYIDYNKAINMDAYMDNATYGWTASEKADIVPNYLEEGQVYSIKGTYSLPLAKSTEAMFYNANLIGINLSQYDATINNGNALDENYFNNLTWEELFNKFCPAILKYNDALPANEKLLKSDQVYHAVFAYDSDDNLFITLAQQYGYDYTALDEATGKGLILFDNPEMKGLMKTFNDAYKKGYFMTKGSSGNKYTNEFFIKQNTLFSVGSTGGVKHQKSDSFDVNVARIPHAEGKDPYVINQGPSVAFLNHNDSNRALASWLFYKFMTNAENSLYWALETGYMPVRTSNYSSDDYLEYADVTGKDPMSLELLTAKNAAYVATVSNELFTSPVFKGSSEARTQAASLMTQSLTASDCSDTFLDGIFKVAVDNVHLAM